MTEERVIIAIGRLDRALTRLEAQSGENATPLSKRHQRLRERTKEAVGALDRLIGKA